MKRALLGVVVIGIVVLGVYFPIVWWITGIAVLLIVVLFVGLKMIDNIYKKIVRFLIKTHIARIDFESESEIDEFNDWLYSFKSQKRKPSVKKKTIR